MIKHIISLIAIVGILISCSNIDVEISQDTEQTNVDNSSNQSIDDIIEEECISGMDSYKEYREETQLDEHDGIHENTQISDEANSNSVSEIGGLSANMMNSGWADIDTDSIVYIWDQKLYLMDHDGQNKTLLSDDWIGYVCLYKNWIFYRKVGLTTDPNNGIYKMKKDGSEVTQLSSDTSQSLYIVDDWIYYNAWSYTTDICRMKLDGSNKETLFTGQYDCLNTDGEYLYFVDFGNERILKATLNGKEYEVLVDSSWGDKPIIAGEWLYYRDGEAFEFKRVKKDGSIIKECVLSPTFTYTADSQYLIIGNMKENVETGEVSQWTDYEYDSIQLLNDKLILIDKIYDSNNMNQNLLSLSLVLLEADGNEEIIEYIEF